MPRFKLRVIALCMLAGSAFAQQTPPPAQPSGPVQNSALDAPLFYQLLIGELELRSGQAGDAYEVILDAARRTSDESLFRRAVEIALSARAGEQALAAARAWHTALPQSMEANRYLVQLLLALNRPAETAEPLKALLAAPPDADRAARIASLPRLFSRVTDPKQPAKILEPLLTPYLENSATRTVARVTLGRLYAAAGEPARALQLAQLARVEDSASEAPVLLALELLPGTPAAEDVVKDYLAMPNSLTAVRMLYVRLLSTSQRYSEALKQLEIVTQAEPNLAPAWLSLGALELELGHAEKADAALKRYLELVAAAPAASALGQGGDEGGEDDENEVVASNAGVTQAYLMLAQASEQRGDFTGAEQWLAKIENPQRALDVQLRRAILLARQGQLDKGMQLIRALPEASPEEGRAKLVAQAQVLREVKQWREAYDVLGQASQRFPDDPDLLYEQAMMAEKLDRLDDMERLLRRVIEIKPTHHHAYNALGYSLADRNQRLPEARELIRKALELSPGEPFITDSLGWVEYRMGNRDEALRLLRQAYSARPDVEIAAHLGEVLWISGHHEEAKNVWRDARARDASNEVLRATLARLRVDDL